MPHAHHFLSRLDRVPRAQADEALALYRDHERVAWILEHARVAKDVPKVALSLGAGDGPYLVVTREGRFVTCLAEGMSRGGVPVVPREQIDALSATLAERRANEELARTITARSGHEPPDAVALLTHRGEALTREEFLAASAWQPLLGRFFVRDLVEATNALVEAWRTLRFARKIGPRADPTLEMAWKKLHAVGHYLLYIGMCEKEVLLDVTKLAVEGYGTSFTNVAVSLQHTGVALRAAWLAGRIGKPGIKIYQGLLAKSGDVASSVDGALALCAIGLRHANHRDEARRALAVLETAPPGAHMGIPELRRALLADARKVLDDPDAAALRARAIGAKTMLQMLPEIAPGSPLARLTDPADVPEELARLAMLCLDFEIGRVTDDGALDVILLPLFARGRAEDFYVSEATRKEIRIPFDYEKERVIDFFDCITDPVSSEPVRRETPKVGRNDPCPCGSGKKSKKCCAA